MSTLTAPAPVLLRPLARHPHAAAPARHTSARSSSASASASASSLSSSATRLTARGRAVILVLVVAIAVAAVALVRAPATAQAGGVSASTIVAERVTVRPGQTLWQIALAAVPDADPRATVARIKEMNGLRSSAIAAGRVLLVPASGGR